MFIDNGFETVTILCLAYICMYVALLVIFIIQDGSTDNVGKNIPPLAAMNQ